MFLSGDTVEFVKAPDFDLLRCNNLKRRKTLCGSISKKPDPLAKWPVMTPERAHSCVFISYVV